MLLFSSQGFAFLLLMQDIEGEMRQKAGYSKLPGLAFKYLGKNRIG